MTKHDVQVLEQHLDVSRETYDMLETYAAMLAKWSKSINLVSQSTLSDIWTRHFLDSAQLWKVSQRKGRWVDLGSGAGFPGLVVAIFAHHKTDISVMLVESDQRKAAFLRTVARQLGLKIDVVCERIETLRPLDADVLTARALAHLSKLLEFSETHLKPDGQALFLKGAQANSEIKDALEAWRFECKTHTSLTDPEAAVLQIKGISRV